MVLSYPKAESPHNLHENRKGRPKAASAKLLGFQPLIGAGEAIRTPDPNLGKVMLYP